MSNNDAKNAKKREELLLIIHGMTKVVNVDLTPDAIKVSLELLESGVVDADALANLIKTLKVEKSKKREEHSEWDYSNRSF